MLIYRLCIEGKNQKSKSQGWRDGSNLLTQYALWGPYEWSGPPDRGVRVCLATALLRINRHTRSRSQVRTGWWPLASTM